MTSNWQSVCVVAGCTLLFGALLKRASRLSATRVVSVSPSKTAALLAACPSLRSYIAPALLLNGDMATLWAIFFRTDLNLTFTREKLRMPDGGGISLDWRRPLVRGAPVALFLHGLTGGSHERYIQWAVKAAEADGWTCVVLIARGCGGTSLDTAKCFSGAFTHDVRTVVRELRSRAGPDSTIAAVGYSLGAGILLKYLCEEGKEAQSESKGKSAAGLSLAVACCPSLDFHLSAKLLEQPIRRATYNRYMASSLADYLALHVPSYVTHAFGELPPGLDIPGALAARTIRAFDTAIVVPLHGYKDVNEYYDDASTARLLNNITIPTLLLVAEDDPICAAEGLCEETLKCAHAVTVVATKEGGHVAWSEVRGGSGGWLGLPHTGHSWENQGINEWLAWRRGGTVG